jgi:hypothetical protein
VRCEERNGREMIHVRHYSRYYMLACTVYSKRSIEKTRDEREREKVQDDVIERYIYIYIIR